MTSATSLGVRSPWQPAFFDLELPPVSNGCALVRTLYSGVSAGTELTYLKGTDPGFTSRRDLDLGIFVPGGQSRSYPVMSMGYMEVAEVVESRREDLPEGSVVAGAYGHRSHHVLTPAEVALPVPAEFDPILGIYLAQMGPICANGLLHAAAEMSTGETLELADGVRDLDILVTGAGVVGLLTALMAVHHGAHEVAVAEPDPRRLAVAEALGAQVIDETVTHPWEWCKQRWHHGPGDRGADLVFQCRGRDVALAGALRSLRPQGTVIDLAFYQGGAPEVRLGEEFHHNGLTVRCAQIARVPRRVAGSWNRHRLADETGDLLRAHGEAVRRWLITDVVKADEAPEVLMALAKRERSVVQLVLDYRTCP
ncbi:MAG TPA: zinc-binding dehydrogenase [Actinomycetota bacterium]|nr:zinc-binding dehydrogenase [Actinomycetota bacterium]